MKSLTKLEYVSFEGNPIEVSINNFRMYIAHELPNLDYLDLNPVTKHERSQGDLLDQSKTWILKDTSFSKTGPAQRAKAKLRQEINTASAASSSDVTERSGTEKKGSHHHQKGEECAQEDGKAANSAVSSSKKKSKKSHKKKSSAGSSKKEKGNSELDDDLNSLLGEIDGFSEFCKSEDNDGNSSEDDGSASPIGMFTPPPPTIPMEMVVKTGGLSVAAPPTERAEKKKHRSKHSKSSSTSSNQLHKTPSPGVTVEVSHKTTKSESKSAARKNSSSSSSSSNSNKDGDFVLSNRKAVAMSQVITADKLKEYALTPRYLDDTAVGRNANIDPSPTVGAEVKHKDKKWKKPALSPIVSAQPSGSAFSSMNNNPASRGSVSPLSFGNDEYDEELEALLSGGADVVAVQSPKEKGAKVALPVSGYKRNLTVQTSFTTGSASNSSGGGGGSSSPSTTTPREGQDVDYAAGAGSSNSSSSNIRGQNSCASCSPTPKDRERYLKEQSDDNINSIIAQIVGDGKEDNNDGNDVVNDDSKPSPRPQDMSQNVSQQDSLLCSPRANAWVLDSEKLHLGNADNTCASILGSSHISTYEGSTTRHVSATTLNAGLCKNPATLDKIWEEIGTACAVGPCPNVVRTIGATRSADGNGSGNTCVNVVCEPLPSGGVTLDALAHRIPAQSHIEQKLGIARGVANGLKHLHGAGLVHGTLRPADIYLARNLEPSIRDYGIPSAKRVCIGHASFPAVYLAPEILDQLHTGEGEQVAFTPKSDIYSFGVVLWQLFEGAGMDAQQIYSMTAKANIASRFMLPFKGSPTEISIIVKHCCAQDPAARPQSMGVLVTALSRLNASSLHLPTLQTMGSPQMQPASSASSAPIESPRTAMAGAAATPSGAGRDVRLRAVAQRVVGILGPQSDANEQTVVKGLSAAGILAQAGEEGSAIARESGVLTLVMHALASPSEDVFVAALDAVSKFGTLVPAYAEEVRTAVVTRAIVAAFNRAHTPESVAKTFAIASDVSEDDVAAQRLCAVPNFWPGLVKGLLSAGAVRDAAVIATRALGSSNQQQEEKRVAFFNAKGVEAISHALKRGHSADSAQVPLLSALAEALKCPEAAEDAAQRLEVPDAVLCAMQLAARDNDVRLACYKCIAPIATNKKACSSLANAKWAAVVCSDLVAAATSLEIRLLAFGILTHMVSVVVPRKEEEEGCGNVTNNEMLDKLVAMGVCSKAVTVLADGSEDRALRVKAFDLCHALVLTGHPGCATSFVGESNGVDAVVGYAESNGDDPRILSDVVEMVGALVGVSSGIAKSVAKKPSAVSAVMSELRSPSISAEGEFSKLLLLLNDLCGFGAMDIFTASPAALEPLIRVIGSAADRKCSTDARSAAGSIAAQLFAEKSVVDRIVPLKDGFKQIFKFITAGDSKCRESLLQTTFAYSSQADLLTRFVVDEDLVKYLVEVLSDPEAEMMVQSQVLKIIIQILKHPELKTKLISESVPDVLKKLSEGSSNQVVMAASVKILNALVKQ